MPNPLKKIESFSSFTRFLSQGNGLFRHSTNTASKRIRNGDNLSRPKYKSRWFVKCAEEAYDKGTSELIGQEFARFILPSQPKTRLAVNENGEYFILSKEVPEFRSFYEKEPAFSTTKEKLENRTYFGLGEVLIVALVITEADLRTANIGVNDKGQVVKIDGDNCFAGLDPFYAGRSFIITEEILRNLPFIDKSQYQGEWLDPCISDVVSKELGSTPSFRHEIDSTILKIILLPESLIREFVLAYNLESSRSEALIGELLTRQQALQFAALTNESFLNYLVSDQIDEDLSTQIQYWSTFTTTGKNIVFSQEHENEIFNNRRVLQSQTLARLNFNG